MSDISPASVLYDANGNAVTTDLVGPHRALHVSTHQAIHSSVSNNTTTNLAANAQFVGTAEETLEASILQFFVFCDRRLLVSVQQSSNGTNWDIVDNFTIQPNRGDSRRIEVADGWFRVVATNIDTSTSTQLRLATRMIPIAAVLPPALTPNGNLKVGLQDETHNADASFTAFGIMKTANESILSDYRFDAVTVPANFGITTTGTGGYTIEPSGTAMKLSTGASGSSKITMLGNMLNYYQSGRGIMAKFSVILGDSGVTGNIREWGLATATDGILLRMSGTSLQLVIRNTSSETVVDASDWDSPVTADANGHLWYIQYQWLGVGDIYIYYDKHLVHTYRFLGTSTNFSIGSPDLPVWFRNENTSNTTDVYLKTGCASVVTEGGTTISGRGADGKLREVAVDASGNLQVSSAAASQNLPLMVNLTFDAIDGAILANTYKRVVTYTVPAGYNGYMVRYMSFQAEAAESRLVAEKNMGTLNINTNAYAGGASYTSPQWSPTVQAEVTTQLSSGSGNVVVTVTYTNEVGTASRTGTITISKGSLVGSRHDFVPQAGDLGVRSIQNLSVSPTLAAGAIKVLGLLQLVRHADHNVDSPFETALSSGTIAFPSGTVLGLEYRGGTVAKNRTLDCLLQLVPV